MTDEQVVRAWFVKMLADFRIYSPLYKVTVEKEREINSGVEYTVVGVVDNGKIKVDWVLVRHGEVMALAYPVMYWGGNRE